MSLTLKINGILDDFDTEKSENFDELGEIRRLKCRFAGKCISTD